MQFSVWPSPTRSIGEILARAAMAESTGWHGFWFADHYMPNSGDDTVLDGPTHECWAVLPAVAATTGRIRIGSLVSPTTVHHPAVLANRAVTIDHLSRGRLVLGIGAGWQINEHTAYGIDLPAPGPRVTRFDEAIQIVRSLLSNDRTTFDGDVYRVTDAPCDPKPIQSPLPILVGTGAPRMLRITARHADEWNTWGDPALATERMEAFTAACDAVARDPSTMRRSVQAMVFFASGDERARLREHAPAGRSIVGTTDEIIEAVASYRDAGFDEFILPDFNLGPDSEARDEIFERFRSEVIAALG